MTIIDQILEKLIPLLYQIPKGKVTTYGILAKKLKTSPRVIGKALGRNRTSAPCHRVVKSDGSIGGFRNSTAKKDVNAKIKLLQSEGVKIKDWRVVNFKQHLYDFNQE